MLIPFVSVSVIGLWAALRRPRSRVGTGPMALAGLVGAWAGFLAGSLTGGLIDLVVLGGFWPFVVGHVGAVMVAKVAVTNRARMALPTG